MTQSSDIRSAVADTPGPWTFQRDPTGDISIYGKQDGYTRQIGYVLDEDMSEPLPAEANATLIAAAPDLLEALVEILGPLNVCSDNPNVRDDVSLPIDMTMGELRKARAAIAKARGDA